MRVFFDKSTGHVRIDGTKRSFAPNALDVTTDSDGIVITDNVENFVVAGPILHGDLQTQVGAGFADQAAAVAYLQMVLTGHEWRGQYIGQFTASVPVGEMTPIRGIWRGSYDTSAGDISQPLPSGMDDGTQIAFSHVGGGRLTVLAPESETIGGDADGIRFHRDGIVEIVKTATDWIIVSTASACNAEANQNSSTTPYLVAAGEHYFGTSGHWWNQTSDPISVPLQETSSALTAAGLTELNGVI